MCICINCYHVSNCVTYYSVETQHEKEHLNIKPCFLPQFPIIDVNIQTSYKIVILDWDVIECSSFVEQPGKWLGVQYVNR
uniref:Conserved hypothetical plastid protein n=1 Tax=Rhodochaete parvula TaxID=110510 RepID=A0A1X9PUV9_9RHOD|nr:conserved hypothetical plastid protein [Rhodochaete parvula]ASK39635.1 hypothetical protein Rhodc_094 [Rhodochaete parvula]